MATGFLIETRVDMTVERLCRLRVACQAGIEASMRRRAGGGNRGRLQLKMA